MLLSSFLDKIKRIFQEIYSFKTFSLTVGEGKIFCYLAILDMIGSLELYVIHRITASKLKLTPQLPNEQ
jgi:hypothetical protein